MSIRSFSDVIRVPFDQADRMWLPHLCPEEGDVVADHAYRSPVALLRRGVRQVAVVPDLDVLGQTRHSSLGKQDHRWTGAPPDARAQLPGFMLMLHDGGSGFHIEIGLAHTKPRGHLYFRRTDREVAFDAGDELRFAFDLLYHEGDESVGLRAVVSHLWQRYGHPLAADVRPQYRPFRRYAARSLRAIAHMPDFVEFDLTSGQRGAGFRNCSSINGNDVDSTCFKNPLRAVWFSPWFNSFRTAFGIARATRRQRGAIARQWRRRAERIKQTLLAAPDDCEHGLIPTTYDYGTQQWWNSAAGIGPGRHYFDVASATHTALWMLRWHDHVQPDDRLLQRVRRIVHWLLSAQASDGSFPAFVDPAGRPHAMLNSSAQCGAASVLLAEWAQRDPDPSILDALRRCCRFFIDHVLPRRKYHDYEAYFSCSPKPLDFTDARTGQELQTTLGLSWVADTLTRTFALTRDQHLKPWAQRAMDDLCLYQQVWNPPYISLYTFGGFGVMNTDGEWSDTRGVFMSELLMRAGHVLGTAEYCERGIAALRATCALICDPLHATVNPCRYDSYPSGLAPENFAHLGYDGRAIRSGFDWGSGALIAAGEWVRIQYGQLYVDACSKRAYGIDGVVVENVEQRGDRLEITACEATGMTRKVLVAVQYARKRTPIVLTFEGGATKCFTISHNDPSDMALACGVQS